MRLIQSSTHGLFDYGVGIALILAPNIFGFAELGGPAVSTPRALGMITVIQALLTDYELGALRLIPFAVHLVMDYVVGSLLVVSPWLFGFQNTTPNAWLPHVVVGLLIIAVTAISDPVVRETNATTIRSN